MRTPQCRPQYELFPAVAHLAEQATGSTALAFREVDVDVVILAADGLLDERLVHLSAVHHDRVVVLHGKV